MKRIDRIIGRSERMRRLRRTDLGIAVKEMLGRDDVSLRGKQEVMLERVISKKVEKILVVVSTGSGKSLMWIMPCIIGRGGGVTVVVIPLKSLIGGIKKDCDEIGLGCLVWNNKDEDLKSRRRRLMFEVRVVVIAPESVNGLEFGKFLDDLEASGKLDRVVINECHCMLDVFDG